MVIPTHQFQKVLPRYSADNTDEEEICKEKWQIFKHNWI